MKKVLIENMRNIGILEFEIPLPGLHIIAGKNGTGKTTLFTCLSRIGINNAYRLGFPTSDGNVFDSISGVISYTVNNDTVKYWRRESGKWPPDKRDSTVLRDFGYPSVINITTKGERVFTHDEIIPRKSGTPDLWLNEQMNSIFGTEKFTPMLRITTGNLKGPGVSKNPKRRNIAYAIPVGNKKYYTERSFSFGEIVVLNLLHDIQNALNGSLILIDELELALHPSAQIRLISCLRDLARRKGLTIIISTHSSSIIRAEKTVILLEQVNNTIEVIKQCPPAKAIGAIGMREDTMPDIIVLVEDEMARCLFFTLMQRYNTMQGENYLNVRILEIGTFPSIINFYVEAKNYVFYDNVYVTAFMDKDVETDIIPYPQFGNEKSIRQYNDANNNYYLRFLPYTPEVLLVKTFILCKDTILRELRSAYSNTLLQYNIIQDFDFDNYDNLLQEFDEPSEYEKFTRDRGAFRTECKHEAKRIAKEIADQINESPDVVYRFAFAKAVEHIIGTEYNIKSLLASTMKRRRSG